jgi:hypothetical protein
MFELFLYACFIIVAMFTVWLTGVALDIIQGCDSV